MQIIFLMAILNYYFNWSQDLCGNENHKTHQVVGNMRQTKSEQLQVPVRCIIQTVPLKCHFATLGQNGKPNGRPKEWLYSLT